MYGKGLKNCKLSDARYSWLLAGGALVKTIRYDIRYKCKEKEVFFVTDVVNN